MPAETRRKDGGKRKREELEDGRWGSPRKSQKNARQEEQEEDRQQAYWGSVCSYPFCVSLFS